MKRYAFNAAPGNLLFRVIDPATGAPIHPSYRNPIKFHRNTLITERYATRMFDCHGTFVERSQMTERKSVAISRVSRLTAQTIRVARKADSLLDQHYRISC